MYIMTPQELDELISNGKEHEQLEFKEARDQLDSRSLFKYCAAIANVLGGKLILGVSRNRPRKVTGTKAFTNPKDTQIKIFKELEIDVEIDEILHPDGRVIVFNIPSRTKGDLVRYKGLFLTRRGEEMVEMPSSEIKKIFAENKGDWVNEVVASNLKIQEVIQKLDTVKYYELQKLPYPSKNSEVIKRLVNDRLITKANSTYSILKLGAILLARNLEEFPTLGYIAPRIIKYEDASTINAISDRTVEEGYAVSFNANVDYIKDIIPQKEVYKGAIREQDRLVTPLMIREILSNALIHRDYNIAGVRPMVEIHPNRVEISNPGLPDTEFNRFIDSSTTRNERLMKFMRKLNLSEEKSSGIDKVLKDIELNLLPPLQYQQGTNYTRIIMYGQKSFNDMSNLEKIYACYQHCCLQHLDEKKMTNQSLRSRFGITKNKTDVISRIIKNTLDEGLIKKDVDEKSKKYYKYLPYWA